MKFTVDRIEEDKAIVELQSGEMLTIPTALLGEATEGDTVTLVVEKKRVDTHSIFEKLRNKSDKA